MSMISVASTPESVETGARDASFNTVVLFSCIGLLASFALLMQGVDLAAGLI